MPKRLLPLINLLGILLTVIGVFIFANAFSGKSFVVGNLRLPGSADTAMFLIMLGLVLFAVSFIAGKFSGKQF